MLEKISKEEKQNSDVESRITRVVHAFPRPLFSDKHQSSSPITAAPVQLVVMLS